MPISTATLDQRWGQARATCGLEQLWFHDLRRTGNLVAARGADVDLAARMSGLVPVTSAAARRAVAPVTAPTAADIEAEVERRVAGRLRELGIEGSSGRSVNRNSPADSTPAGAVQHHHHWRYPEPSRDPAHRPAAAAGSAHGVSAGSRPLLAPWAEDVATDS